jgi:hypothetical protein
LDRQDTVFQDTHILIIQDIKSKSTHAVTPVN